ncbi:preprotein translocase subunit SecY [Candidatus Geothermarchaeota archaeon]|nr:MAG: preprotein translocase subunit SecY [Candidatus Geothermarchaeota archaeon]
MGVIKSFFKQIAYILPEVEPPKKKISLRNRFIWSGIILILYLIMGNIPLYGVRTGGQDWFAFLRVIFASSRGTLIELGIGPIVTAGLIMQLLAGAEIIKFDFTDPEERGIFTAATKFLTIIVTIVEATAMIASGYLVLASYSVSVVTIVFLQLVVATILVMLMDELVQKGWGLGSGISLFIAAGVAQQIFIRMFSPLTVRVDDEIQYFGAIPFIIQKALQGDLQTTFMRTGNYPSLLGLITTLAVIFILIYTEGMRIEIPISHAQYRGIRGTYPVKLLYVSNIPIILASTLLADINMFATFLWSRFNPNNQDPLMNLIVQMETTEGGGLRIVGGLLYYVTAPTDIFQAMADPIRSLTFVITMIILAILFAVVWVEVGGLSSEKVAEQLVESGMQIPGFRRRAYSINLVLKKYIPLVTVVGGFFVGVIAGVAQLLGVFGSGMGILLMVDILMNYYQILMREQFEELYPSLARLVKI